jgi:hypothetical protein
MDHNRLREGIRTCDANHFPFNSFELVEGRRHSLHSGVTSVSRPSSSRPRAGLLAFESPLLQLNRLHELGLASGIASELSSCISAIYKSKTPRLCVSALSRHPHHSREALSLCFLCDLLLQIRVHPSRLSFLCDLLFQNPFRVHSLWPHSSAFAVENSALSVLLHWLMLKIASSLPSGDDFEKLCLPGRLYGH